MAGQRSRRSSISDYKGSSSARRRWGARWVATAHGDETLIVAAPAPSCSIAAWYLWVYHIGSADTAVLLQPNNTEIVGGMIEDLEATQAESFIASLKARMENGASGPRQQPAPQRRTRTAAIRPPASTRPSQTPARVPPAIPSSSSRPQRAAGQTASTRIGRFYEQTAIVDRQMAGPSTRQPPPEDEFDDFDVDEGFLQHVSAVETRGNAQIFELDSDDYGDDLAVDDSFIRQVDAVEARTAARGRRQHVLQSETESDMDSGKENRPIVIDSN